MSFLGGLLKAIPVVGDVIGAIDGANNGKSQSTATAHAGSNAQLASNQAQALIAGATPIRQAAEAALLARLRAGPGFGVKIPDLSGIVDKRNPFRKNYAMPLPMPTLPQAPPLAPTPVMTAPPLRGGGEAPAAAPPLRGPTLPIGRSEPAKRMFYNNARPA